MPSVGVVEDEVVTVKVATGVIVTFLENTRVVEFSTGADFAVEECTVVELDTVVYDVEVAVTAIVVLFLFTLDIAYITVKLVSLLITDGVFETTPAIVVPLSLDVITSTDAVELRMLWEDTLSIIVLLIFTFNVVTGVVVLWEDTLAIEKYININIMLILLFSTKYRKHIE